MTERAKKKAELKRLIRRTCKKMTPPEVIRERMDWLEEDGVSFFSHFFKLRFCFFKFLRLVTRCKQYPDSLRWLSNCCSARHTVKPRAFKR